jgi:methyl-accepting chemotaxis protein
MNNGSQEIKNVIQNSVERVGKGNLLVGPAEVTMTGVVPCIQRLSAHRGEINAASKEQSQRPGSAGESLQCPGEAANLFHLRN